MAQVMDLAHKNSIIPYSSALANILTTEESLFRFKLNVILSHFFLLVFYLSCNALVSFDFSLSITYNQIFS